MKIQVDDLSADGRSLQLAAESEVMLSVLSSLGSDVSGGQLCADVELSVNDSSVVSVSGSIEGQLQLACARCLEPVAFPLHERFSFFMRGPLSDAEAEAEDDVELSEADLDYAFYEGGVVDVSALLQEQILLFLPSTVLCQPDCKGICQRCGAELNREACRCVGVPVDSRFEVLKRLKLPS